MGTIIAFPRRSAGMLPGEIEARAYYRLCRFLFDRALAEGDAREVMTQLEDVLAYPLPLFGDERLRKERDDLAMVMVGMAFARFVDDERRARPVAGECR
ncbi:MAG TPA: hypothetical protein VIF40_17935 [Methylosinus sp.]|uniref:hypothetical protein n=1 Tax=Methylosinus sp. TaxID=427 RepID=UPI002F94783A